MMMKPMSKQNARRSIYYDLNTKEKKKENQNNGMLSFRFQTALCNDDNHTLTQAS